MMTMMITVMMMVMMMRLGACKEMGAASVGGTSGLLGRLPAAPTHRHHHRCHHMYHHRHHRQYCLNFLHHRHALCCVSFVAASGQQGLLGHNGQTDTLPKDDDDGIVPGHSWYLAVS